MEEEIKKKINEIHVELNGSSSVKHITATSTFQALSQMLSKNDEEKKILLSMQKAGLTCILPMKNPKRTSPRVATIMAKTISPE